MSYTDLERALAQKASSKKLMDSMMPPEDDEADIPLVKLLSDKRRAELSPRERITQDPELRRLQAAMRAQTQKANRKRTGEFFRRLGGTTDKDFLKEEAREEAPLSRREALESDLNAEDAKVFAKAIRDLDITDFDSIADMSKIINNFQQRVQSAFQTMAQTGTTAARARATAFLGEQTKLNKNLDALLSLTSKAKPTMTEDEALSGLASVTTGPAAIRILAKLPTDEARQRVLAEATPALEENVTLLESIADAKRSDGSGGYGDLSPGAESSEGTPASGGAPAALTVAFIQNGLKSLAQADPDARVVDAASLADLSTDVQITRLLNTGALAVARRPPLAPVVLEDMEDFQEVKAAGLNITIAPEVAKNAQAVVDPAAAMKALEDGTSAQAEAINSIRGAGAQTYGRAYTAVLEGMDPGGKGTLFERLRRAAGIIDPEVRRAARDAQVERLEGKKEKSLKALPDTRPTTLTRDEIARRYMQRLDKVTGGKLVEAPSPGRFAMRADRAIQKTKTRGRREDPTAFLRRERFKDDDTEAD